MKNEEHAYGWPEVEHQIRKAGFDKKLLSVLLSIIETNDPVLQKFRAAYLYRSQFPWLEDARGLEAALSVGLRHRGMHKDLAQQFEFREVREIDDEFKEALAGAARELATNAKRYMTFWHGLHSNKINLWTITEEILKQYVIEALKDYSRLAICGTGPDPW